MKVDPNQAPQQTGKADQEAADPSQGGQDASLTSPFFGLLSKGRRGAVDPQAGGLGGGLAGEAAGLLGEKGKGKLFAKPGEKTLVPGEGGVNPGLNPEGKGALRRGGPGLGQGIVPGMEGGNPEGKIIWRRGGRGPGQGKPGMPGFSKGEGHRMHNPLSGHTPRGGAAGETGKTFDLHTGRKPGEGKRFELSGGEHKMAAPTVTPHAETPVVRHPADQPAVNQVHAAGSTANVERVQALAQEMVDKLQTTRGPDGRETVDIQFNSQTLQGLQVSISRDEGGVSIRFQTASEHVNQLLTQNVQTLVQTLAAKGLEIGDVRVMVPNTNQASDAGNRFNDSRQEQRQGGGRGGYSGGGSGGGGGFTGGGQGGGGQRGGR